MLPNELVNIVTCRGGKSCNSITFLCWQWLDVDAAEAEGVEEEEVEAGEAQGDNRTSNMLSDIPLFVHFFFFWH